MLTAELLFTEFFGCRNGALGLVVAAEERSAGEPQYKIELTRVNRALVGG